MKLSDMERFSNTPLIMCGISAVVAAMIPASQAQETVQTIERAPQNVLENEREETLAKFDLDRRAFHLLGRLRSYGPPYRRSPGQLAGDMRLSSGAMTNRLDRLEAAGLVRRLPEAGTFPVSVGPQHPYSSGPPS